MTKLNANLIIFALLLSSGCGSTGTTTEAGEQIIKRISSVVRKKPPLPAPRPGLLAAHYETQIRTRIAAIAEDFDEDVREDVKDIVKEVLCISIDYLETRNPPTYENISLATTNSVSRRDYTLEDSHLVDEIYKAVQDVQVGSITAIDGLKLVCQ